LFASLYCKAFASKCMEQSSKKIVRINLTAQLYKEQFLKQGTKTCHTLKLFTEDWTRLRRLDRQPAD
jgi:hypothetical protein